ncbi:Hypothetical predicted protein [Cloeon dipterum]|uniref:GPR180/TMEM145 transmembrane domain-containing protein n=1 Tax=Cloeon dipterum TaxID=197152 RepID=A0A8S1D0X3_9INSE|nr:Hypothetical predicted protein [Cloeon dipterum]
MRPTAVCVVLLSVICVARSAHLRGTWNTADFFHFLAKFGIQKANMHNARDSLGYIYGNVTTAMASSATVTLAVLDRGFFLEYYGNRTVVDGELACRRMMHKIDGAAYDAACNDRGKDFLRRVPCPLGGLCDDEDPANVINGHQFTFTIQDLVQPRFWYLSLVACYRNETTCQWHHLNESLQIDYDLWLVNGNPNASHHNALELQFSFDKQNTLEISFLFLLIYVILVPLQIHAVMHQKHPVTRLFLASVMLEMVAMLLEVVHGAKYAVDGVGVTDVAVAGDILDILSRTLFMLLLLLLAKGWAITRIELTWKPLVFGIWMLYGVVHILLYVWNTTEVDIIEDIDEYQTWPGWLILIFRTLIMGWFLLELRYTMLHEHNAQKLNFLLHFGASALVWFIYLPIIALIALQISSLYRFKLILGITYSADALAYCVICHLLWPTRSEQYLLLADSGYLGDELDEFNEAPHVVNSYAGFVSNGELLLTGSSNSSPRESFSVSA